MRRRRRAHLEVVRDVAEGKELGQQLGHPVVLAGEQLAKLGVGVAIRRAAERNRQLTEEVAVPAAKAHRSLRGAARSDPRHTRRDIRRDARASNRKSSRASVAAVVVDRK